jgi:hypothetical protein
MNGTWTLNVAKSTYSPGPPPPATLSDVRRFATIEGGWNLFELSGTNPEGDPTFQIVAFKIDGKQYPVHTPATLTTLLTTSKATNVMRSYRRIDDYSVEFTTYTDGKPGIPVVRRVSKDGKTYTQTTKGTDAKGQAINNVLVFDRVR